jgi:hypothetical protein
MGEALEVERNCSLRKFNSQPVVVSNFSRSPLTKPFQTALAALFPRFSSGAVGQD